MTSSLMRIISVFALAVLSAAPAVSQDQRWLWVSDKAQVDARHLTLEVTPLPGEPGQTVSRFQCAIASDVGFRGAHVKLVVSDEQGKQVSEGALAIDIEAGANSCTIALDSAELPLGTYDAVFSIDHTLLLSVPSHTYTLRNVSVADLERRLGVVDARARELTTALDALENEAQTFPYLRLKVNIVADVLQSARANEAQQAWESLERELHYMERSLDAVHADMVFSDMGTERSAALKPHSQSGLLIQDGGFIAGSTPVFLFGGALPEPSADAVARLRRYQLNAATITLRPAANPAAAEAPGALDASLASVFDAATSNNVSLAIQLAPEALAPVDLAAAPGLDQVRFADIADATAKTRWEAYLAQVGPLLQGQSMLMGVSLAQDPHFHFDGDDVKAGFLAFVRANYPDRINLNRAWRSHLATLDDIELWSENPYDNYQTHRPFQYDWQTYHEQLGNAYFDWSRATARRYLPGAPLMVTLPDTGFLAGEAVYNVDRELLSDVVEVSACTGLHVSSDPVYGMGYPRETANYILLRSFEPNQPVFDLFSTWELPEHGTELDTYRFVHSALWEGVMSGLSGATIPMDSLVFQKPEALEAFATAALDINRLAPIVMAFQMAPVDVGILYSQSSKVFDHGAPHLKSARHAYEGTSFGGYNVRFVTERQCNDGILDSLKIVVIPDTPAVSDATFKRLSEYVEAGGTVARTGAPIPYNERGFSRDDLIRNTASTVLVRGLNLPTEYLHAMDAATVLGTLPQIPRVITPQGYPIEGVKSRYVEFGGDAYLYVVNLRKDPAYCTLATQTRTGRDLIQGQDVTFPTTLEPLEPMLIKLAPVALEMTVTAAVEKAES